LNRSDRRSPEAAQYRKLYKTSAWAKTRESQFRKQPLCEWCKVRGRIVAAAVCHHVSQSQKLRPETFFAGPFTSLCKDCHDGRAQQIEVRGYSTEVGADGFPIHPKHPSLR